MAVGAATSNQQQGVQLPPFFSRCAKHLQNKVFVPPTHAYVHYAGTSIEGDSVFSLQDAAMIGELTKLWLN